MICVVLDIKKDTLVPACSTPVREETIVPEMGEVKGYTGNEGIKESRRVVPQVPFVL